MSTNSNNRAEVVKQKVISVNISPILTKFGNPDGYLFLLECGHCVRKYHSANTRIKAFMVIKGNEGEMDLPTLRCYDCEAKREVRVKWLRTSFPWRDVKKYLNLVKLVEEAENAEH